MKTKQAVKIELTRQWLAKADEDLGVARHLFSQNALFPNAIAFHAQQASEKYLKACLVWYQIEFPKTHGLTKLMELLAMENSELAASLAGVSALTEYGVDGRYPGDLPALSKSDLQVALDLASLTQEQVKTNLPK